MNLYRVWFIDKRGDKDYDLIAANSRQEAWEKVHRWGTPVHDSWVEDVEIDGKKVGT